MIVRQILKSKGATVTAVSVAEPIANVATLLTDAGIGAVLVHDACGQPAGILSERDIVAGLAIRGASIMDATADSLMTTDLITCSPNDHIDELMRVVTDRRVRHLPVIENGHLAGIISIGDLVKARIAELETEGEALQRYIAAGS